MNRGCILSVWVGKDDELVVRAGNGTKVASTVIRAGWKILRLIK